ncbi:MAG: GAF domain-containing protein [Candidatus Schekmanbacteria bacterium]|nr:GAF domain-containing protein [Candidatus Schekmanbacteria bacterium]
MDESGSPTVQDLSGCELASRVYEISLRAHGADNLVQVLQAISRLVLALTGASYAAIFLPAPKDNGLAPRLVATAAGIDGSSLENHPRLDGVVRRVAGEGQALCLDDLTCHADLLPVPSGMRSAIAVPLARRGDLAGVLIAASPERGKLGRYQLGILEALATPISQAIANAELVLEVRHRLEQLRLLNAISKITSSTVNVDELLARVVLEVRTRLGYHLVAAGLVDDRRQSAILRAISSAGTSILPIGHTQPLGTGVVGRMIQSQRSTVVRDVLHDGDYVSADDFVRCEMCVPLKRGDVVIGYLDAEAARPDAFDDTDVMLLETIAEHISQSVWAAAELQRARRLREDLARMIVHDMRNPLTVLGSSLFMVKLVSVPETGSESTLMSRLTRFIDAASAAGEELRVMVDGVLDVERIEVGRLPLRRIPCNVADLVSRVARQMAVVAVARNVQFLVSLPDDTAGDGPLMAHVDEELLSRVLENLVINALKYSDADAAVSLGVAPCPAAVLCARLAGERASVLFSVSDTGPGIPADQQQRIFDKFAGVDDGGTRNRRSVGLGLAFCRQAVEAHGGTIWVTSEVGRGARFNVLLPSERK